MNRLIAPCSRCYAGSCDRNTDRPVSLRRLVPLVLFLLWSALFCLWCCRALAAGHEAYFEAAAREVDVPPDLTKAIAHVESDDWPWALNVAGRSYFYESKAEAVAAAREAEAAGRSFDVGAMQVNNWWLKRYGISLEAAFDPAANILFGSWILKQELDRAGDTWTAVGRYHSPNASRGQRYANQVRQALERGPVQTKKKPDTAKATADAGKGNSKAEKPHPALAPSAALMVSDAPAPPAAAVDGGPLLAYRRDAGATPVFARTAPEEIDAQPFVRRMP